MTPIEDCIVRGGRCVRRVGRDDEVVGGGEEGGVEFEEAAVVGLGEFPEEAVLVARDQW